MEEITVGDDVAFANEVYVMDSDSHGVEGAVGRAVVDEFERQTGVPVVPCRVYGSFQAFGKGTAIPRFGSPVSVVFGPPIPASDYDDPAAGKARYETAAQRIMDRIAALPAPVYPVI